jgi:hypothetical protein
MMMLRVSWLISVHIPHIRGLLLINRELYATGRHPGPEASHRSTTPRPRAVVNARQRPGISGRKASRVAAETAADSPVRVKGGRDAWPISRHIPSPVDGGKTCPAGA